MSQLARVCSSQRDQVIATALECLERFRTIRSKCSPTPDDSKYGVKYCTNMANFCDHMEYLLIENFIPDQEPIDLSTLKQYDFDCLTSYLDRIVLVENNLFERFIYKKLLSVFFKIQKSEGRDEVAKLLWRSGKRRAQMSKIIEQVKDGSEEDLEVAIRSAEDAGIIRLSEKMSRDESMLAVRTHYVKCSFGDEKLENDFLGFELVDEEDNY